MTIEEALDTLEFYEQNRGNTETDKEYLLCCRKALTRHISLMVKTKVVPNPYGLEELEVDYCPACNNVVKFGDFFCSKCGQAIKFVEWNENEIDRR